MPRSHATLCLHGMQHKLGRIDPGASTLTNDVLSPLFDLGGRAAIVTGGTRGIGLAIAEALVQCGANVCVASRKPDACAAAADKLRCFGRRRSIGRAHPTG
jgi:hypothetical protein